MNDRVRAWLARSIFGAIALLPLQTLAQPGRFVPLQSSVPDFRLADARGGTISLAAHRGQVVVVNFWATWCAPCREELPALERLWQLRGGRGVVVIAVASGEEAGAVRRFVERLHPAPTFAIGVDPDRRTTKAWKVRGLPTTVGVGRDGRAHFAAAGQVEFDSAGTLRLLDGRARRGPD